MRVLLLFIAVALSCRTQVISGPLAAIAVATRGKAGTQVLHISLGGAGLILVHRETS